MESIDRTEKGLTNLRTRAAALPAKEVLLKQAKAELADRERGLIPGDTADQAQAQLLQVLRRVAKAQSSAARNPAGGVGAAAILWQCVWAGHGFGHGGLPHR